jgi:Protein of unknown function (DUF3800)
MLICYVDEAGCPGELPSATSKIQPVLVVAGLVIDHDRLRDLSYEFMALKERFFPGLVARSRRPLDRIRVEVKGAELRAQVRSGSHRKARHAVSFLDRVLKMVENHEGKLTGRIWIKGIAKEFKGQAVYTSSTQCICNDMQNLLCLKQDTGMIIADARTKSQNANVAHSIFTKKFKADGDAYDRILEMPTFGHSENHAGLQVADLICSALLFPIAAFAYCLGHVTSVHVQSNYCVLRSRFGKRLRHLQHRYKNAEGRWQGGLVVSDQLGKFPGGLLFEGR